MKLIDCYIENYGKFSRRSFAFEEGLTCFCLKNGEGKTTFSSFLKAMLFGLEGYRESSVGFCERRRFFPFSGGKFGGWLRIEWQGKRYTIERFFDEKSEAKDSLRVYDDYGRICNDLGVCPGERVFGVSLAAFERTLYIDTEKLKLPMEGGAGVALGEVLADTSAKTFSRALQILDEERKRLHSERKTAGRYTGAIPETAREIFALEEELYSLEKKAKEWQEKKARLAQLEARIGQAEGKSELQKPQKKEGKMLLLKKPLSLLFAFVLSVVGGLVFQANIIAACILFFAAFFSLLVGLLPNRKTAVFTGQVSNEEWLTNLSALLESRAVLKEELALLEREFALLQEKKERLYALKEEKDRLEKKRKVVETAKDKLLQAEENLKGEYFSPMSESFLRYLRAFDKGRFGNVRLDGDMNAYFESGGARRESRHYSDGEKTILQFAMRLALMDNLYKRENPFLVLDDPFVYLDEESLEVVERALKSLAKDRQILYFCCHGARKV